MTDRGDEDRKAVKNLEMALVDRLLALSPEEFLAEEAEAGTDIEREAEETRRLFERAAGKVRMAEAKAGLAAHRAEPRIRHPVPANDLGTAEGLTLAARNGTEQTEADVRSVAEDLAELATFQEQPEP